MLGKLQRIGAPQESVLGRLVFHMLINDVFHLSGAADDRL